MSTHDEDLEAMRREMETAAFEVRGAPRRPREDEPDEHLDAAYEEQFEVGEVEG